LHVLGLHQTEIRCFDKLSTNGFLQTVL